MKLVHIPTHFVHQIWEKTSPFIANALEYAEDDYSVEQVKVYLSTGNWLLIAVVNELEEIVGALTVSFINFPNDRVAFINTIGGKLITGTDTYSQLKNILKSFGATKVQGYCRDSMVRLWQRFGAKAGNRMVEEEI